MREWGGAAVGPFEINRALKNSAALINTNFCTTRASAIPAKTITGVNYGLSVPSPRPLPPSAVRLVQVFGARVCFNARATVRVCVCSRVIKPLWKPANSANPNYP